MSAATVAIAHSDVLVRDSVAYACERAGFDAWVCEPVGADLIARCAVDPPDVLLLDYDCRDGPAESFVGRFKECGVSVVVIGGSTFRERALASLDAGAAGYMAIDQTSLDQFADAVRSVRAGGIALDPTHAAIVVAQWREGRQRANSEPGALTQREREVLGAMVDGLLTKAIARRLRVAPKTVENHKVRIFSKLGVRNQAQAVGVAITHGLVSDLSVEPSPS
ncbi:MAG TPA: response regulator transcription factor [Acidimicrobiia bacterium]